MYQNVTIKPVENPDLLEQLNMEGFSDSTAWWEVAVVTYCCKKTKKFFINGEVITKLGKGEYIQVAMPEPRYTADERELLISGICKDHWDSFTSEKE